MQKSPWCQFKTTQSSTCASLAREPKQTMSNRAFRKHNTKLPNRCLSSSERVSLCSVAASDFPYALLFDIASIERLLTFNSLSELQAANASFLCIVVRANVLLEVEKYLPSFFILRQRCKTSSELPQVEHKRWWGSSRLSTKKKGFPTHSTKSVQRNCCFSWLLESGFFTRSRRPRKNFLGVLTGTPGGAHFSTKTTV